jgi:hypothetical protein
MRPRKLRFPSSPSRIRRFFSRGTGIRSRPKSAARSCIWGRPCSARVVGPAAGTGSRSLPKPRQPCGPRDGHAAVKKRSVSRSTSVAVRQPRNCCRRLVDEALLLGPAAGGACLLAGIFRGELAGGSLPRRAKSPTLVEHAPTPRLARPRAGRVSSRGYFAGSWLVGRCLGGAKSPTLVEHAPAPRPSLTVRWPPGLLFFAQLLRLARPRAARVVGPGRRHGLLDAVIGRRG